MVLNQAVLPPVRLPDVCAAHPLAAAFGFVAIMFLLDRYATVNWAASGFAVGFITQALGLAALATRVDWGATSPGPRRRIGLTICAWALLGHPLLAVAFDRPWTQAEVFGLALDPNGRDAGGGVAEALWPGGVPACASPRSHCWRGQICPPSKAIINTAVFASWLQLRSLIKAKANSNSRCNVSPRPSPRRMKWCCGSRRRRSILRPSACCAVPPTWPH